MVGQRPRKAENASVCSNGVFLIERPASVTIDKSSVILMMVDSEMQSVVIYTFHDWQGQDA